MSDTFNALTVGGMGLERNLIQNCVGWPTECPIPHDRLDTILESYPHTMKAQIYNQIYEVTRWKGPIEVYDLMAECAGLGVTDDDGILYMMDDWDFKELIDLAIEEGTLTMTIDEENELFIIDTPYAPKIPEKLDMPELHVFEAFAGIGAPRKALSNLGIPHTSIISEIDKYAPITYNAIHGETQNIGDITAMGTLPEPCDLVIYGSPCQDISIAGNQAGDVKGSGTRSSLIWEIPRLIRATMDAGREPPAVLLGENVANIVGKNHRAVFDEYLEELRSLGYTTTYAILNPPNFGIPQSRKRCFYVSLRGRRFEFPEGEEEVCMRGNLGKAFVHHVPAHFSEVGVNNEGIRKLTPRECFELMGFDARDEWKAENAVISVSKKGIPKLMSDAQLYKQAGNSMVVNVVQAILKAIYIDKTYKFKVLEQTKLIPGEAPVKKDTRFFACFPEDPKDCTMVNRGPTCDSCPYLTLCNAARNCYYGIKKPTQTALDLWGCQE